MNVWAAQPEGHRRRQGGGRGLSEGVGVGR